MKTHYFLILFVFVIVGVPVYSQSSDQNYILTRTYTSDDASTYLDQIQYYDGLGRPIETVQAGITPSGNDLVTYQEYDGFGRESNAWLPGSISGNGAFQELDNVKSASQTTNNDTASYSYPVYEASPLNRVLQQFEPGGKWHANNKSVNTAYLTNNSSYPCTLFEVGTGEVTYKGKYSDGSLYVTKITGEGDAVSYEFKDKLGQVVLTRQINDSINYDTYYIYDDFGNRRYVLPPLASDVLTNGTDLNDNSDTMEKYAYVYKYDSRNRCIKKRLPGCDWVYYVYDKADRLIMTQDGVQHTQNKWTVNNYDKLGRLLYTSEIYDSSSKSADTWNNTLNDTVVVETTDNSTSGFGYTRTFFASYQYKLLTVNYYDSYDFVSSTTSLSYAALSGYGTQYSNFKGLLTGTRQYQLNDSTQYTITANYYDYRGRVIQTKATNHLGGTEAEYIVYDFLGDPTQKKHVHTSTQAGTVTELYAYTYDHAGRLTKTTHQLNDGTAQVLAQNTYDELGRLQTHKAGNSSVVNASYDYNVRSWTDSIYGSNFNEGLSYNYDGNISGQTFGKSSSYLIHYDFVYDNLSRLTGAFSSGTYGDEYQCTYDYDKQGNSISIITNGTKFSTISTIHLTSSTTSNKSNILVYNLYDELTLTYNGNQLKTVSDAGDVSTSSITEQFFDYADSAQEYTYNANGAMTKDLNKGISSISYNLLNLPQQVDILSPVGEARNTYVYAADGTKLQVVKKYNSNYNSSPIIGSAVNTSNLDVTKTTDYVGNLIFENNVLDRILVDGGYIKDTTYYFYETDHLGDNRTVVNQSGTVTERDDYYPYGMQMAHNELTNSASGTDNKYKFGGKELDVIHGLNLYDSQARSYDPTLGRFTTVDPMAEKYYSISPYAYCADNPLRFVDPTGMDYGLTFDDKTKTVTVSATYYTTSSSLTSANQSATTLNKQSGNYTYTVGSGNTATTYTVNFDVKVVEVKVDPNMGEIGSLSTALGSDKSGQGNIYRVISDSEMSLKEGSNTNGTTSGGDYIRVRNSQSNSDTGAHEMGHTLGLDHNTSGLMTPSSTDPNRSSQVTKSDVKDMISYPLKGKVNYDYDSNGNRVDAGRGTVINNTTDTNDQLKRGRVQ